MNIGEIVVIIKESLKKYNPVELDYGEDKVIGFVNNYNGNDLVIYLKKDDIVMTFGFQNAHFDYNSIEDLCIHTEKYLDSTYSCIEFFDYQTPMFGGTRNSNEIHLDNINNIIQTYTLGNYKMKQKLIDLFKTKDYNVRALSFNGTINIIVYIHYNGKEFEITRVR